MSSEIETTELLQELSEGRGAAAGPLFHTLYEQLHDLAERRFRSERRDHTLQPTALVNEAFVRLVGDQQLQLSSRAHFLAIAATVMRRILIDHARRINALVHGGGQHPVQLEDIEESCGLGGTDILILDEALEALAKKDERKAKVVELRFFAGMTVEEVAHVLQVSKGTVEGDWRVARAWLKPRLHQDN